jgi:hypothetical protein
MEVPADLQPAAAKRLYSAGGVADDRAPRAAVGGERRVGVSLSLWRQARAAFFEHDVARLGADRREPDHDTLAGVEDLGVVSRDQLFEVEGRYRFSWP